MTDNVYKLIEIVGTSHVSVDDAIKTAIERAQASVRKVRWFEVMTTRGAIDGDGRTQYQVTLKVGFTLDAG